MSMTSTTRLNVEHNDWLRSLDFYKGELNILKHRLTEVAGKNTGEEASVGAGHFENQFTIQSVNIDNLRHQIQEHLATVAAQSEKFQGHIDTAMVTNHNALREQYILEEKVINELRHEFYRYAAKWM